MRKGLQKHTKASFWRMPECREMSKVITASLDEKLSWSEWLLMKTHLVVCDPCSNFFEQIKFIRASLGNGVDKLDHNNYAIILSEDARHRIKYAIKSFGSSS